MRPGCASVLTLIALLILAGLSSTTFGAEPAPDYSTQIAPLLTKYCGGCHKSDDPEGKLSVLTWDELQKGGEHGPAFLPGDAASSRMMRLMTSTGDNRMPPEGEKRPKEEEIALIKAWIDGGAKGPSGKEPDRPGLVVPHIESHVKKQPVTAIAASPDGKLLAVAGFGEIQLLSGEGEKPLPIGQSVVGNRGLVRTLSGLPGKVQSLRFSKDSKQLVASSGVSGLAGKAFLYQLDGNAAPREFDGHRDTVYDAELSPAGSILATCSYDRKAILWDAKTGKQLRVLEGHNGAIYDVAFSPDGKVLGTASADDTCKLWSVATGERLDTLSQPLKECYCIAFSPDGKYVLSGGADSRIRIWEFLSKTKPVINPQIEARFAHEGAILQMAFTPDGQYLVTTADNKSVKLWETKTWSEVRAYPRQPAIPAALAIAPNSKEFYIGRLDGSLERYDVKPDHAPVAEQTALASTAPVAATPMPSEMTTTPEREPNNSSAEANTLSLPGIVSGAISGMNADRPDADFYRFTAKAGQTWIFEIKAARNKSPLDSQIEILTTTGQRIPRVVLQGVKESYFTFRGKNGSQSDDFRLFNWEEMELNEYLYCNGEVVKLWRYPRGPDSGFNIYPGEGMRWGEFDTTGLSHALGEPCYVVRPHAPGSEIVPNGLPVFTVYWENDDDAMRELGADSRITFTAPSDGDYVIRVNDIRGQQGEKYAYTLTARPPQPDYEVTLTTKKLAVSPGSANEFRITAKRKDGFMGPIRVDLEGLPAGFTATTPVIIEENQIEAFGQIAAAEDVAELPKDIEKQIVFKSSALIGAGTIEHPVAGFTEFKVGAKPKVKVAIVPIEGGAKPLNTLVPGPLEFVIEPGQTIMLKMVADRINLDGLVPCGKEDAGRNLPYGVYVDNVGLSGLILLEKQTEREFFITASKVAVEQTRPFFIRTTADGIQASQPVILHVRKRAAEQASR